MDENRKNDVIVLDFGIVEDQSQNIIKVIGVGGGGQNAVRNMYDEGIEGVTFAVCNTDSAALSKSPVPVKLQLGTVGLGAGANPDVGRKEAESNIEDIERLLDDGTKMVFVTAGMGGGTGTGAAPVVAKVAKDRGILTIGVVTIPFYFEQKRKIVKALRGVDELRKHVDAMLIVNNERICDIYSDTQVTLQEALKRADDILKNAVKGISELITISTDGGINLDFRDVETTMRNGGGAIMAIGRASGERRVERAIIDALDSPLLYGNDIGKAKRILFNIYASEKAPFFVPELSEIAEFFDQLDPNIDVIWGTAVDNTLDDDAKVIILAADMDDDIQEQSSRSEYKQDDNAYYESLIPKLYKPFRRNKPEPEEKPEEKKKAETENTDKENNGQIAATSTIERDDELQQEDNYPDSDENILHSGENGQYTGQNTLNTGQNTLHTGESEGVETKSAPDPQKETEKPHKPASMVERWKRWLERKITEVVEDEE
ncbi:MAG: cell division protein FtsZ [Prevotella sp.]|nr:cell division protein FtsZ [Prevotella sp.]